MIKQKNVEIEEQSKSIKRDFSDEDKNQTFFTENSNENSKGKVKAQINKLLEDSEGYFSGSEEEKNDESPIKESLLGKNFSLSKEEEVKPKIESKKLKEISSDSKGYSSDSEEEKKVEIIDKKPLPEEKEISVKSKETINPKIKSKKRKEISSSSEGYYSDSEEVKEKEISIKKNKEKKTDLSSDSEEEIKYKIKAKESSSESEEEKQPTPETKLFIGNLSYQATYDDLKNYFSKCGEISSLQLVCDWGGYSKGIAYINFTDIEATNKALELNGIEFMGRILRVLISESQGPKIIKTSPSQNKPEDSAVTEQRQKKSTTIFARNLSFTSTIENIQKFFENCGEINDVRIAFDSDGNSRGFAFIEFLDRDSAERAIKLNGSVLDGRKVELIFQEI